MTRFAVATIASLPAIAATQASAAPIVVTFEGLANQVTINNYYNGGTASDGTSGANLGVGFTGLSSFTGAGNPTSTVGYNSTATAFGNVAAGFNSLSFTYGFLAPGTVSVFSGLNGTGTLLGTTAFTANQMAVTDPFSAGSVTFAGIGQSFALIGSQGNNAIDNITLNAAAVPEAATWAMMLVGFGAIGLGMRRRQQVRISYAA